MPASGCSLFGDSGCSSCPVPWPLTCLTEELKHGRVGGAAGTQTSLPGGWCTTWEPGSWRGPRLLGGSGGGGEVSLLSPCTFWAQMLNRYLSNGANENWCEEFVFYQVAASFTHLTRQTTTQGMSGDVLGLFTPCDIGGALEVGEWGSAAALCCMEGRSPSARTEGLQGQGDAGGAPCGPEVSFGLARTLETGIREGR